MSKAPKQVSEFLSKKRIAVAGVSRNFQQPANAPAGRAVAGAIKQQSPEVTTIHPQMNIELDLGIDSLARAECIVSVERLLGVEVTPEAEAAALTVGEVIALAQSVSPERRMAELDNGRHHWRWLKY